MLRFARVSLALLVLALAAGPALALPLGAVHASPTLTGPAAPQSPVRALAELVATAGVAVGITIRKDVGTIAQKFVTRAQAASGDYKSGVQAAGTKWEQNTGAAEPNYEQGVQAAISSKRFAKGITGKGTKYQNNAVNLGSQRYGPGVANAQDAYSKGMAPVLSVLSGLTLPPKSFRGSPSNQARSNAVATALAALRTSK